ncbi:hypothetical protein [Rhodoplanes azumiensis]|uniref:Uncharacterized protein n=1 Tax=Rhodoplanes azumiensis TaxID=1897628 RepID=A0ABW5AIB2_9BRAD
MGSALKWAAVPKTHWPDAHWPDDGEALARMREQRDPVFGDRPQDLVFIDTRGTLNRARIATTLDRGLVEIEAWSRPRRSNRTRGRASTIRFPPGEPARRPVSPTTPSAPRYD